MKLIGYAISDPNRISEIERELDEFVAGNSENPFMLSAFIKKEMESALRQGYSPTVIVYRAQGKIVSVVPIRVRKRFGVGFASLLFEPWFSPDFIAEADYSGVCMCSSVNFIFNHLRCRFETFYLPEESASPFSLERTCEAENVFLSKKNDTWLDHSVVAVEGTWEEFQKSKNHSFRKRFKQIEQQLTNSGNWRVTRYENGDHDVDTLNRILEVEKSSWKQNWRDQKNLEEDRELLNIWDASATAAQTHPNFRRAVWFLELNGQPIAYTLVLEYRGKAYTFKTSYDNRFRKLSPGIYLKNAVLRDLFNSGRINMIDFMTNLPFQERWTQKRLTRTEFNLSKGLLPSLFGFFTQKETKAIRRLVPKALSSRLGVGS